MKSQKQKCIRYYRNGAFNKPHRNVGNTACCLTIVLHRTCPCCNLTETVIQGSSGGIRRSINIPLQFAEGDIKNVSYSVIKLNWLTALKLFEKHSCKTVMENFNIICTR